MTIEVSQVLGAPEGTPANFPEMPTVDGTPVVESGSNSDGEWIRWADGTQIVSNTEPGSGIDRNVTYPRAFILNEVNVTTTMLSGDISNSEVQSCGVGNIGDPSIFSIYPRYQVASGGGGVASQAVLWIASGRWK